mmetsp:Transcript_24259/g.33228  ORF Transcript_24259/g.33228 Transcript_24259/m.33228 type:complete len:208 (-) Transcript_24259:35-658(-)
MFAPTTSSAKSGIIPVNPNTVVFKYFSCPQRSMSVMARSDWSTTSAQRWLCCLAWGTTCSPSLYPISSTVTAEVLPFSCSCLCRSTSERASPRPSSRQADVRTPIKVDFPLSTLPIIATRTSSLSTAAICAMPSANSLSALSSASSDTSDCNDSARAFEWPLVTLTVVEPSPSSLFPSGILLELAVSSSLHPFGIRSSALSAAIPPP